MKFTQHLNQETADQDLLSLPGSRMMDGALESISVIANANKSSNKQ